MELLTTPGGALGFQTIVATGMAVALVTAGILRGIRLPLVERLRRRRGAARVLTAALVLVAGLSAVAYFYGSRSPNWLHRWDLYHTSMSAKYFDELGYTGLYECTYVLGRTEIPNIAQVARMRDLETQRYADPVDLAAESDCATRFSPEREQAFIADLEVFDRLGANWPEMLQDKGYNGTPFYTLVATSVFERVPLTSTWLHTLALLDVLLLAVAFTVVGRVFGLPVALVAATFFFVDFPNRFTHMGGSFLRFDYIAALMIGVSALKARRTALAGGAFAYATMVRAFPVLFAVAFGVKSLHELLTRRRIDRGHVRFAVAFGGVTATLFAVSLVVGGMSAWAEWFEDLRLHSRDTAGFRIGFRHLFMLDGNLQGPDGFVGFSDKTDFFLARRHWYSLAVTALLGPVVLTARRIDRTTFTVVLGTVGFYLLLVSTRYYYAILVLLLLTGRRLFEDRGYTVLVGLLFLVSALGYQAHLLNSFAPWNYNTVFSALMGAYTVVLVAWLLSASGAFPREPHDVDDATRTPAVHRPMARR